MSRHGHSAMRIVSIIVILFWPMGQAATHAQGQCPSPSGSDWDRLISFRPSTDLQRQARTSGWTFQRIESGAGDQINLDYYAVVIDRSPRINGSVLSAEAFLEQIRNRFAGFIARDQARFGAARPDFDAPWRAGTVGAVMTFTILPTTIPNLAVAVPAQVMLTENTPLRWIFSTGHLTNVASHPVNGNREFGVVKGAQNTFTLYTRGADTLSNEILRRLPGGSDSVFGGGERIWEAFQEKVIEFVNSNGGHVSNTPKSGMRYCWSTVRPQHFQPTVDWLGQASQPSGRVIRVRGTGTQI